MDRPWLAQPRAFVQPRLIRGPVQCSPASRAPRFRCPQTPSASSAPLGAGLLSHLGARPVLARFAGSALPMPPDPVGELGASRRLSAPLGAGLLSHPGARPVLARFAGSALPMPPDPVGQLGASRRRPPVLACPEEDGDGQVE